MKQYTDLRDILKTTLRWEKDLRDLYDVAELGLSSAEAKDLVRYLISREDQQIEVLERLDVSKFGSTEWVKFANDFGAEGKIPKKTITRDSSASEIVSLVAEYEKVLKDFYTYIAKRVSADGQRDLFESLATLKNGQIESLENYRLSHSA